MTEAEVGAERPVGREPHILSEAVGQGTRKLLVQAHIMGSHTEHAVGRAVGEAHGSVELRRVAAEGKDVDACRGVDVDKTDLSSARVGGIVDETHLHTARMGHGNVYDAELQTAQRVGIVVRTYLQAAHHARGEVEQRRHLQAAFHASCHVAHAAKLQAAHVVARNVVHCRQLHTLHLTRHGLHGTRLHTAHLARTTDKPELKAAERVGGSEQSEVEGLHAVTVGRCATGAYAYVGVTRRVVSAVWGYAVWGHAV